MVWPLDDDVAEALGRIVRERGVSFKETVNSVIRAGLAADKAVSRPYRMPTSNLGPVRPGINLDKDGVLGCAGVDPLR